MILSQNFVRQLDRKLFEQQVRFKKNSVKLLPKKKVIANEPIIQGKTKKTKKQSSQIVSLGCCQFCFDRFWQLFLFLLNFSKFWDVFQRFDNWLLKSQINHLDFELCFVSCFFFVCALLVNLITCSFSFFFPSFYFAVLFLCFLVLCFFFVLSEFMFFCIIFLCFKEQSNHLDFEGNIGGLCSKRFEHLPLQGSVVL